MLMVGPAPGTQCLLIAAQVASCRAASSGDMPMRRRHFLNSLLALGAAPALVSRGARAQTEVEVLGYSAGGIAVSAYWVGSGTTSIVVQGAHHGGPEANTATLVYRLRDHYQ